MTDDTTGREPAEGRHAGPQAGPVDAPVARGRGAETPVFLLGGLTFAIGAVVAVLAVGLLLVWWLA
jgi:hypothetical protein